MLEIQTEQTIQDKLRILADAAKYDVACTSSGVDRKGKKGELGNAKACGICHSFSSDGRCVSLLKILMTNHCVYDCKYCINRVSNDVPRATFTPREICELTIEFYKRNYIEGLFLSSGVLHNPSYTMEKICDTLQLLRTEYHFNGYIHVKVIPGASDDMLARAGHLADRISVNLELPTAESLKKLAPNKSFNTIIKPMEKVSNTIAAHRLEIGKDARMERSSLNRYLPGGIFGSGGDSIGADTQRGSLAVAEPAVKYGNEAGKTAVPIDRIGGGVVDVGSTALSGERKILLPESPDGRYTRSFAPAGQSTQMIIGASEETDYNLLMTTQKLYQYYDLKRVFYSAYIPLNDDSALPSLDTAPPLLREHRLYQADWLLRFYGFQAQELLTPERPNFNEFMDPKCNWAVRHLEQFPVEIQTAPVEVLLRIPGVGPKSVNRIVAARRYAKLTFEDLKKMGVVLKRAHYFITCGGKMMFRINMNEQYITRQMIDFSRKENWQHSYQTDYRQMSLFDDFKL